MLYTTTSATETEALGAALAKKLKPGDFVALYGDLGAGKTAFVRGAASVLCPDADVCSPTYAIVNRYSDNIFHFDLYRITDEDDLYSTGYYDCTDGNNIIFCEWCEKCPYAIPVGAVKVTINRVYGDDDKRTVEIC